ncbi:hypothetical protein [Actinomadura sp. 9N215]|uniref:hypothetical protein n=1 Tax=Actinomadura sp. 9N215 TaxID=3375150 RepID=UPI0037A94FF0
MVVFAALLVDDRRLNGRVRPYAVIANDQKGQSTPLCGDRPQRRERIVGTRIRPQNHPCHVHAGQGTQKLFGDFGTVVAAGRFAESGGHEDDTALEQPVFRSGRPAVNQIVGNRIQLHRPRHLAFPVSLFIGAFEESQVEIRPPHQGPQGRHRASTI